MASSTAAETGEVVIVQGDLTLYNVKRALGTFKLLTDEQMLFAEAIIMSQLPRYYGEDFKANERRLKDENGMEEIYQHVLIDCPRGWGRTLMTANVVACSLATVPDYKIVVYTPGQRVAAMFMELVRQQQQQLCANGYRVDPIKGKNNLENLWVRVDGNTRSLVVLPANSHTVRGTGADLIICEDADAMEVGFFKDVLAPLQGTPVSCVFILPRQPGGADKNVVKSTIWKLPSCHKVIM